ncbi:transporter substrate-binding domain-containing protein [Dongia rigui]|uniref:Transporter substrate-binding domain-containing protein n=1 Tax=Dongia rigui TaxID=940149 RepID=A0ABU5DU90_9PROT|nr:transporter substrate-binding domain-containing protein [Dongia rigui]MDY0870893.1 transporter substrate-binding domain-containing protein [Dongia rigui]
MARSRSFILAAVLVALAASPALADKLKLIVAVEGAFPPYNEVGPDGNLQGFDVDVAHEICKKIEAECEYVKQDWDGMIPGLLAKKYDVIISSMGILPEREEKIDFTIPYYQAPTALVALKSAGAKVGADGYPDGESLAGLKIGVQRATAYESWAREKWPKAEIVVYDSSQSADLDIQNGRLDARFDDYVLLSDGIMKGEGANQYERVGNIYTEAAMGSKGEGIALRKGNEPLKDAINKAILAMREDGSYKAINDKYFSFDIYGE